MIKQIIRAVCIGCGEECSYADLLCDSCVAELPAVQYRCKGCGHPLSVEAVHCRYCRDRKRYIDHYYADYYYTGDLKTVIKMIKYHWHFRGASQLGRLCRTDKIDFSRYDVITIIPYHFRRKFSRYLQPVNIIAGALAERSGLSVEKLLDRKVHTEFQSRLNRRERLKNVQGAFTVPVAVKGKKVLLVDDIITTGATVKEAAGLLKRNRAARVDVYSLMAGVPR